ncbi:MAG: hypothetical protein B7Y25_06720 [Alphaproteobacteria bacterium 16-39-46]|nr:MAG: hypothetical protein B7Y25_06720 [Alphaproteobacteria bacterium 16-39-46]OZA42226.1 MAG: hypothetical protein B7X84_06795 [Alphaproteobacteria bacterium 17-39-52]HQS84577.1 hypothetical protein [Alphaproteobacteria bacterium]HQS94366.1 hypothetical protein [Alphaproteobacteria bacterium]
MLKKMFSTSFTILISFFFLTNFLNAALPEITESDCDETPGRRLRVTGSFEVPQKDTAPLSCSFRTCLRGDFVTPDGRPGLISTLRADPKEMKYYIGGPKDPRRTLLVGYEGIWRKRLIESDNGNYTPATLFTLSLADQDISYFAIGRNTDTQLIFFGSVLPEFQNRGIMTGVAGYLLDELLPAFRESPLTSVKSKAEHKELLITMDNLNPLAANIASNSKSKFEAAHNVEIKHILVFPDARPNGEHQLRINLEELYAKRAAAAQAASALTSAASGLSLEP